MPREIPVSGALDFAATSAIRAQSYREHAAQLRRIAKTAPTTQIRDKLFGLAKQFECLVETVETLKRRRQ